MAEVKKKGKDRFGAFSTELPGVQLRIEPGTEPALSLETIRSFYRLTSHFAEAYFQIGDLTEQQVPRKEEIIIVVEKHEGLRGLTSEEKNFVLTAIPVKKIVWDRELLQKSMGGVAYSAATTEELAVNVLIPVGFVTGKGITISEEVMEKAIGEALVNLGIVQEDLAKIVRQKVNISLDEKKLTEMINQGQVELLPGAKTSEITWTIRVDRLK